MNIQENPCHEEESAFIDALTEYRKQKTKSLMQPGLEPIPRDKDIVPQVISAEAIEKLNKEIEKAKKRCEEARQKRRECWDKHGIKYFDVQFKESDDYK